MAGLGAVKESFVVVAREVEPAVRPVFESVQQHVGERACPRVVRDAKPRLHELEERREQERVVVEIRVEVRVLALACREEPAVVPCRSAQRVGRARRDIDPRGHIERARGAGKSRDRECVPRGQDLVVEPGSHTQCSRRPERSLRRRQPRGRHRERDRESRRDVRKRHRHAQVPGAALEIRWLVEPVVRFSDGELLRRDCGVHFVTRPDVELALLAIAVGVEARKECAVLRAHLARQPADDAVRDLRVARITGHSREVGVERNERPVVVEHLFEMRNRPLGVDAVPAEASTELIVDAAVGHALEGEAYLREGLGVAGARVLAQAEFEVRGMRKFGRGAESAMDRVEPPLQLRQHRIRGRLAAVHRRRRARLEAFQRILHLRALLGDRRSLLAIGGGHAGEEIEETGQPVAPPFGK